MLARRLGGVPALGPGGGFDGFEAVGFEVEQGGPGLVVGENLQRAADGGGEASLVIPVSPVGGDGEEFLTGRALERVTTAPGMAAQDTVRVAFDGALVG